MQRTVVFRVDVMDLDPFLANDKAISAVRSINSDAKILKVRCQRVDIDESLSTEKLESKVLFVEETKDYPNDLLRI